MYCTKRAPGGVFMAAEIYDQIKFKMAVSDAFISISKSFTESCFTKDYIKSHQLKHHIPSNTFEASISSSW